MVTVFSALVAAKDGSCYALEHPAGRVKGAKGLVVRYPDPFGGAGVPELLYACSEQLADLWVSPSGALHAVGKRYHTNRSGDWESHPIGKGKADPRAIWGVDDRHLWVVASEPSSVFSGDGERWEKTELELGEYAVDIDGAGPKDIYVAADEGLAHFDGAGWKTVQAGDFSSVGVSPKGTVLAEGEGRIFEGTAKGLNAVTPEVYLYLWGAADFRGAIYLAMQSGELSRYDRKRTTETVLKGRTSFGFSRIASNDACLWAADVDDLACFDGESWRRVACYERGRIPLSWWPAGIRTAVKKGSPPVGEAAAAKKKAAVKKQVLETPEEIGHKHLAKALKSPLAVTRLVVTDPFKEFPRDILACRNLRYLFYGQHAARVVLPEEIGQLSALEELNLGGVAHVPAGIGELTKLKKWDLMTAFDLKQLPRTIGKLHSLMEWTIGAADQLAALPSEIGELSSLTSLWISGGGLRTVPVELWALSKLRRLSLPGKLETVPAGIGALTQLEELRIPGRVLGAVAPELPKLGKLRVLEVSGTLTALPDEVGDLTGLRKLDLAFADLQRLPKSLARLANLRELRVNGNQLTELAWLVAALPKLARLEFEENKLPPDEKRRVEAMLRVPFRQRAAMLGASAAKRAPATSRSPRPKVLGTIAGYNSHLSTMIFDAQVAAQWRGDGDGEDKSSDWDRACKLLGKKTSCLVPVGDSQGLYVDFGLSQGYGTVYAVGDRIVFFEQDSGIDENDALFLEYIASDVDRKAEAAGTLEVKSGGLVFVLSMNDVADARSKLRGLKVGSARACSEDDAGLIVGVQPGPYEIRIEAKARGSWGTGRRLTIARVV